MPGPGRRGRPPTGCRCRKGDAFVNLCLICKVRQKKEQLKTLTAGKPARQIVKETIKREPRILQVLEVDARGRMIGVSKIEETESSIPGEMIYEAPAELPVNTSVAPTTQLSEKIGQLKRPSHRCPSCMEETIPLPSGTVRGHEPGEYSSCHCGYRGKTWRFKRL